VFICVIYCVTWLLAAPGMGAPTRCIISEDKDEGAKVAFNFHSRKEYRRVPLVNAEEVDKALWYAVLDADVEGVGEGVKLTNIVKVQEPPVGLWIIAIRAAHRSAADEVVRRDASALIGKHADSREASKAAKYWAQTYERELAYADALKVYEDFIRDHPEARGLRNLQAAAGRIRTHGIGKPNWGRFYFRQSQVGRLVMALTPEERKGPKGEELRELLENALLESKQLEGVEREREKAGRLLLGCIGKDYAALLRKMMFNETGDNARAAVNELFEYAMTGDAKALALVEDGLSAPDADVRRHCAQIVGELKHAALAAKVIALLSDENALVRNDAIHALGRLRAEEAREALEGLKETDPSPDVRGAAERALKRLGEAE